jgi:hypothetical protein
MGHLLKANHALKWLGERKREIGKNTEHFSTTLEKL